MIRSKLLRCVCLFPLLAGSVALSACGSTGTVTPGAPTLTMSQVVADALLACQGICAVAPTALTITQIIVAATGSASAGLSEQVAQEAATAFCNGVLGKTSLVAGRSAKPRLRAVPRALANGVVDYGKIVINGKVIDLQGVPQS